MTPYEKLCTSLIGEVPENRRGKPRKGSNKRTTKDLAKAVGLKRNSILEWKLIPGTNIRIIPPGRAGIIEKLSNGAVTAEEIRDFARRYQSDNAA